MSGNDQKTLGFFDDVRHHQINRGFLVMSGGFFDCDMGFLIACRGSARGPAWRVASSFACQKPTATDFYVAYVAYVAYVGY